MSRLDPGTTKNLEGRIFYLTSELKELLKSQRKAADRIQRRKGMIVQHVFFHDVPTKDGDVGLWSGHAIAPSGFYTRGVGPGSPPVALAASRTTSAEPLFATWFEPASMSAWR